MDLGLRGKAALVTGASEGIGEGIARALAGEGVEVAICARTESKLKDTAARITEATGVRVVPVAADLRTLEGCESFVATAAEVLGRVDILINNAGASRFAPFVELSDEEFTDAVNGKFLGYVRCTRAAIPHLRKQGGGSIVNITGATLQAPQLHTAGGSCNVAIRMFSKILSHELAPLGIRVNSLAPGLIQTARADRVLEARAKAQGSTPEAVLNKTVQGIPSRRIGTVEDIARTVLFLVSDQSSYINGAAISVDGGSSVVI
ncbi:MAG TPA: SDR family oxidoreductase [Dehalococcoidia bacterium]|nr:SDR family oxidoreductase [Dehalococcoidia bacterium]